MTADDLKALLAAAAPGTRVTLVTIEVPAAPTPTESVVPKPWTPTPGALAHAPAIAERREPFTSGELAEVLRVKPDTVGMWCRLGALPGATKAGGAGWRIPPAAVLAMLAGGAAGGAAGAGRDAAQGVGASTRAADAGAVTAPPHVAGGANGNGTGAAIPPALPREEAPPADLPPRAAPPLVDPPPVGPRVTTVVAETEGGDVAFDVSSLGSWRTRRNGGTGTAGSNGASGNRA